MKDIVGTKIKMGDKVVFNPPQYKGLKVGYVTRFTPKGVTITCGKKSKYLYSTNRPANYCAVIR